MCNHFRQHPELISDWAEWAGYRQPSLALDSGGDAWPKREAFVARCEDETPQVTAMAWGVPIKVAGKRAGTMLTKHVTNVRNLESRAWVNMLGNPVQRCLVPFSSFAEPKAGKDALTGRPAEYWFSMGDGKAGAFAGLWRVHEGSRVFAFLTCEPNALVAPCHPKAMPVILQPEDYERWLNGSLEEVKALQAPFPSQLMRFAEA
jgi:putative SOS response-associated peptidase YedK